MRLIERLLFVGSGEAAPESMMKGSVCITLELSATLTRSLPRKLRTLEMLLSTSNYTGT